jgi:hypothetical protein
LRLPAQGLKLELDAVATQADCVLVRGTVSMEKAEVFVTDRHNEAGDDRRNGATFRCGKRASLRG